MVVWLAETGGDFRAKPGPEARAAHRRIAEGKEIIRRVRVHELAKQLGIASSELLVEIAKQGIRTKNAQTSFDPDTAAQIVGRYCEQIRTTMGPSPQIPLRLKNQRKQAGLPATKTPTPTEPGSPLSTALWNEADVSNDPHPFSRDVGRRTDGRASPDTASHPARAFRSPCRDPTDHSIRAADGSSRSTSRKRAH